MKGLVWDSWSLVFLMLLVHKANYEGYIEHK